MIGAFNKFTNLDNKFEASGPALITPPPPYIIGFLAFTNKFATIDIVFASIIVYILQHDGLSFVASPGNDP